MYSFKMVRNLALVLVLAASSVWLWSQQVPPTAAPAQPPAVKADSPGSKLEFETITHDFGHSIQGQNLKCTFRFKNTGTGTVNILKVKGG